MNPLEKLHTHHEQLISTIRKLTKRAEETPSDTSLLLSYCDEYLIPHAEGEEIILYPAYDDAQFLNAMIREHKEIKHRLDVIERIFSQGELQSLRLAVADFLSILNDHFQKEESDLIPRLDKKLSQQEFDSLIDEAHETEEEKKKSDITSLFELDHKRIDLNIFSLKDTNDPEATKKLYSKIRSQLLKHIELEETVLFPAFEEHAAPNQMTPIQVMISEHREITSLISTPGDSLDSSKLSSTIQNLAGKLAAHNKKEELILYPLINRAIPREEKHKVYKKSYEQFQEV